MSVNAKVLNGPVGWLVVIGVGGAALYWLVSKLAVKGQELAKPVANVLADSYLAITQSSPVTLSGGVLLPTGANIPMKQIQSQESMAKDLTFVWSGVWYRIASRDGDNYIAVLA